jgi:threonine/homoserine/homoserine lactone efflux protein
MESDLLLRGVYIGLAIAAPVGPIGVLCITRTLAGGRTAGFFTGLGAASADAVYGSVAGFGLTIVSDLFLGHEAAFRIVGGVFLCLLGLRTFFRRPPAKGLAAAATTLGLAGAYASALVLTLTNPLTILSFAAVFAGLGLAEAGGSYLAAVSLVAGVFLGSALWWGLLSFSAGLFREKVRGAGMRWINGVSGVFLAGVGVYAIAGLF